MQKVIEIVDGVTRHPLYRMKEPVNLCIRKGEQTAIVGENGSGKTRLIDIITGRYPLLMNEVNYDFSPSLLKLASENIKYISFRDSYGDTDTGYYYQQRWNQHDIDENTPTVRALLDKAYASIEKHVGYGLTDEEKESARLQRVALREKLYTMFHLDDLLDEYIISLSSGEMRKFQLTKAMLSAPRILILDNPYIGLDANTREQLNGLLQTLIEGMDLQVILVLSKTNDIPSFITHIIPVKDIIVLPKVKKENYIQQASIVRTDLLSEEKKNRILALPQNPDKQICTDEENNILLFNKINISYGNRHILKNLDWAVKKGEKWALHGENGAGKSTLLSLVCADNPQGYACHIELFGKKRGSGESIWDIKKYIGYVSPEMHRSYLKDIPAIDIVASGLNDTVGLYVRPKQEQYAICEWWMDIFGIAALKERTFLTLSSGEQRLCLLARAFVKDPELLILDEPLHGLDDYNRQLVKEIITTFGQRKDKTIIMVTHYEEELPQILNHKIFLHKNK